MAAGLSRTLVAVIFAVCMSIEALGGGGGGVAAAAQRWRRESVANDEQGGDAPHLFIFPKAPQELARLAKMMGQRQRLNYVKSLESGEARTVAERARLYSDYFSRCADIGEEEAGKQQQQHEWASGSEATDEGHARTVRQLVELLNFDAASTEFFNLPLSQQRPAIRLACLKSELKFQCAYGFLNSLEKIEEHIALIKQSDGNFRVMAERECRVAGVDADAASPSAASVYSCVNGQAEQLTRRCEAPMGAYNATRRRVNSQVQAAFNGAIAAIDERLGEAAASAEEPDAEALEGVLRTGESLIAKALAQMAPLEALKCRQLAHLERCVLTAVAELCPAGGLDRLLSTLIRVGHLRRERGDFLHQHFLESPPPPPEPEPEGGHRACRRFH